MGVEPFLISSTLEAVLGQRLLRSICRQCHATYQPNDALLAELGISRGEIGDKQFFYGKGCDACNHTGYKGRKGIYELLKITDPLRELINERAPTVTIKQKAIELGLVTLRQDGLRSIFAGDTTIEEVLRVTQMKKSGFTISDLAIEMDSESPVCFNR
jgi:type IV pilus assembly protein PilB